MLILFILFVIVTELTPYDKNVSTDTDDTKQQTFISKCIIDFLWRNVRASITCFRTNMASRSLKGSADIE